MTEENPRSPQETEDSGTGLEQDRSGPRRFDITPMRARRALYSRLDFIRVALLVLGAFAIGLTAFTEWLALQPVPYPAVVLPTLDIPQVTPSPPPAVASLSAVPATLSSDATGTAIAGTRLATTPTQAAAPTAVRTRRASPAAIPAGPRPSPTPYPAPIPLEPADGVTASGRLAFRWQWAGPPLKDKQAFDLRIWSEQEQQRGSARRGAVALTKETRVEVDLAYVPAIRDFGPGIYYWSVVLVESQADGPPQVIGTWGESRTLVYH